jgi:hypothetical protein
MPGGGYRTQSDLVVEALSSLGVVAVGQAPNVEDVAYVADSVDGVLRMLAALDICYIADPDNIPGAMFEPLANILAGEVVNKFGLSSDDFAKAMTRGLGHPPGTGDGAMALKQMNRGRPTYEPLRAFYF